MSGNIADEIVFSPESVELITEKVAEKTLEKIDFDRIKKEIFDQIPKPRDGRDGKDLILTEAIRADVISAVNRLQPKPKPGPAGKDGHNGKDGRDGANYNLTDKDRLDIANLVKTPSFNTDEIIDQIVDAAVFVTKERLQKELRAIREILNSRPMNAGISGRDMIQEIEKVLGGSFGGDMSKSVYDTDNNGKVDIAEEAEAVDWPKITNKPATFPPSIHDLDGADHNGIAGTENNFMALDANGRPKDSAFNSTSFLTFFANGYVVMPGIGNDSNNGKSIDTAFATIGAALAAVSARSPSASNLFIIYLPDGSVITEDFTMQPYTVIYGPGAKLIGEVVAADFSHLFLRNWDGKTSGAGIMITKPFGELDVTRFTVLDTLDIKSSQGVSMRDGLVNIQADTLVYGGNDFIGDPATGLNAGQITIYSDSQIKNIKPGPSTGKFINITNGGLLIYVDTNSLEDSSTSAIEPMMDISTPDFYHSVNIQASYIRSLFRPAFKVGQEGRVSVKSVRFVEGVASIVVSTGKLKRFIPDNESNANKAEIDNVDGIALTGDVEVNSLTASRLVETDGSKVLNSTTKTSAWLEGGEYVTAPALPGSTGTRGQWSYSGGNLYRCIATDTWVRWAVVTSWT